MSSSEHLLIGGLVFPGIDQLDFTGPFEVLSRLPNSTFHVIYSNYGNKRSIGIGARHCRWYHAKTTGSSKAFRFLFYRPGANSGH